MNEKIRDDDSGARTKMKAQQSLVTDFDADDSVVGRKREDVAGDYGWI